MPRYSPRAARSHAELPTGCRAATYVPVLALAVPRCEADTSSMSGPRLAVALGVVLLLLGFATGTSVRSASVDGVRFPCAPVLDLTRVPFTESGAGPTGSPMARGTETSREDPACRSATLPLRRATWAALGLGALVGLAGWTAARERTAAGPGGPAGTPRRPV